MKITKKIAPWPEPLECALLLAEATGVGVGDEDISAGALNKNVNEP